MITLPPVDYPRSPSFWRGYLGTQGLDLSEHSDSFVEGFVNSISTRMDLGKVCKTGMACGDTCIPKGRKCGKSKSVESPTKKPSNSTPKVMHPHEEIINHINSKKYKHYGLRVATRLEDHLNDDYIAKQFPGYKYQEPSIGETLPDSYKWKDGIPTKFRLKGVSALKVTPDNLEKIMNRLRSEYGADSLSRASIVLVGSNSASKGEDLGEIVMKNGSVVYKI